MGDDLSLLFRLRGESAGAKNAIAETRSAINSLRQSAVADFKQIQGASTSSLAKVVSSTNETSAAFAALHQELFGKVINDINAVKDRSTGLSTALNLSSAANKAFAASVDDLAKKSGKSNSEIAAFVSTFAKLQTQTEKTDAAFKFFGGSVDLIGNKTAKFLPELEALAVQSTATATGFESLLSTLGPVGIAIAGIAIQIGATVAVVGGLIEAANSINESFLNLAKSAAGFRGELFDLSQQTGVSVETLSTLSAVADTTGSSIQSVTAALGIFQKNLDGIEDPTSKGAKALKELGVNSSETETALRATLAALAKLPEGSHQTALALEIFGRGGKVVLAILKEMKGDLDGTTERLRKMGLVVSREDAEAADKFNDQLRFLELRFRALLGNDVIPAATDEVERLGKFLDENREQTRLAGDGLRALGFVISNFVIGSVDFLTKTIALLTIELGLNKEKIDLVKAAYDSLAAAMQLVTNSVPNISPNAIPIQSLASGAEDGLKLLQEAQKAFQAGLKPFNLEDIFGAKKSQSAKSSLDPALQLLRQLQAELRNVEGATKAQSIAAELLDQKYKNSNPTLLKQIQILANLIDIKKKTNEADAEAKRLSEERQKLLEDETDRINDFIFAQERAIKPLSELDEANKFIGESFLRTGKAIEDFIQIEIRLNAMTLQARKDMEALGEALKHAADALPTPSGVGQPGPFTGGIFDVLPPEPEKRFRGLQSAIDDLGESLGKLFGASKDFKIQFGDVIGGAVSDLAQGVGSLVEQYVLLGETGPHALRKLLAATLAHLAAEAAVKAVFQLAEGFAALFFNPAEAAAHFTSAALFGSIAGVAAIAGRSVAGDLFKQPAGGGSGTSAGNGQLNPLTLGRNQPSPNRTIVLQIQSNDSHIVKVVGADIRGAGPLRELILNDGGI